MWSKSVEILNPYNALTGEKKKEPKTNADRIRAMNDEELEELLQDAYNAGSDDAEAWHFGEGHRYSFEWDLKWLQSPAEREGE